MPRIKLKIITWNVGNEQPAGPESLIGALDSQPDVLVVGMQESTYQGSQSPRVDRKFDEAATAPDAPESHVSTFVRSIEAYLNGYTLASNQVLGQMELAVFVRDSLADQVGGIAKSVERTGVLNVIANKGGIAIRLNIFGSYFGFVSSHLAAHAGTEFVHRRNEDVMEILRGTRELAVQPVKTDLANQFHYVFWFGDLNYRICPGACGADGAAPADKAQWEQVKTLVDEKKWDELLSYDELRREQLAGNVLVDLQEGNIQHPPSFKIKRAAGIQYQEQRIPSYCDRILWKTFPGLAETIKQTKLEIVPDVSTSDHKPIRALFEIDLPEYPKPNVAHGDRRGKGAKIKITELIGSDLAAMDNGTDSDPYIVFSSLETFGPDVTYKTGVVHKNLNPIWSNSAVPEMDTQYTDPKDLDDLHLFLVVYDEDRFSSHDTIGSGVISLKGASDGIAFNVPLYKYGRPRGYISGRITAFKSTVKTAAI